MTKNKSFFSNFKILFLTTALTVSLFGIQLFFKGESLLLGQDFSSITDGILAQYPFVVLSEVLKLFFFTFFVLMIAIFPLYLKKDKKKKNIKNTISYLTLLGCSFFCLFLYSIFLYPSVYENFISHNFAQFIFSYSKLLNVNYFIAIGYIFLFFALITQIRALYSLFISLFLLITFCINSLQTFKTFKPDIHKPQEKPNILLIAIDSLRQDRVLNKAIVPNISSFTQSSEFSEFQNHFVGTPRTFPSWKEILSGTYGASNGIRHMFPSLPQMAKSNNLLTHQLRSNGYYTAAISDFAGDIFPRFDTGFNEVFAPKLTLSSMIRMNINLMFPALLPLILTEKFRLFFPSLAQSPLLSDPKYLTHQTIKQIKTTKDQPWFITTFYSTAHFPYAAPWPYYSMFSDSNYTGRYLFQKNPDINAKFSSPTDLEKKKVNELYNGSLRAIDDSLTNIISFLKESDTWDNTIIIITADHGEDLYEDGNLQGHGEHLRGHNVSNVPLLIKPAKKSKMKGSEFNFYTRSIDIAPTILGLSSINPQNMSGINLTPWLKDPNLEHPNITPYSETGIWFTNSDGGFFQNQRIFYPGITHLLNFDPGRTGEIILNKNYESTVITAKHRSLIEGKYKLIYIPTSDKIIYELYDIEKDPQNKFNLIEVEINIAERMKQNLNNIITENEKFYKIVDGYVVPI